MVEGTLTVFTKNAPYFLTREGALTQSRGIFINTQNSSRLEQFKTGTHYHHRHYNIMVITHLDEWPIPPRNDKNTINYGALIRFLVLYYQVQHLPKPSLSIPRVPLHVKDLSG